MAVETPVWAGSPSQITNLGVYLVCGLVSLTIVGAVIALPYALWQYFILKCQRYELTSQRLKIHSGVFNKKIDDLELYRIRDTKVEQPFFLRLFGLGDVMLVSTDSSTPTVVLHAVEHAEQLREQIRHLVEQRREAKRLRVGEFD